MVHYTRIALNRNHGVKHISVCNTESNMGQRSNTLGVYTLHKLRRKSAKIREPCAFPPCLTSKTMHLIAFTPLSLVHINKATHEKTHTSLHESHSRAGIQHRRGNHRTFSIQQIISWWYARVKVSMTISTSNEERVSKIRRYIERKRFAGR